MGKGALLLFLTLVLAGCRGSQEVVSPASTPVTETTQAPTYTLVEGTPYRATPLEPPRLGVLIADSETAQINLRAKPTTQSEPAGSITAGTEVELHRLAEGEGGYSWYFVKLDSGSEGWVRGDFIDTTAAADQAAQLTENACGEEPQAAFFETDTFAIYICKTADGLRYIGTNKVSQKSLVTEEVETSQGTYIAIDGNVQYHLNDVTLAVYRVNNGEYTQLLGEPIIRYQRFD